MPAKKTAIIIGAGPAGLTAAFELLKRTNIKPIVFEEGNIIGGISRTIPYKGNRIDIGGHRFFSKSDRVMKWWFDLLPLQGSPSRDDKLLNRKIPLSNDIKAPDPEKTDRVMLVRNRLSRIFYLRKFFDYPVTLNSTTIKNLGLYRIMKIGLSYLKTRLAPIKNETSLEDFFINRFGHELYLTFFKDYTEKVWGISCSSISKDWGAQRIKGLSLTKTLLHAIKALIPKGNSLDQKNVETSLIEMFYYPKYGPGHLWNEVAKEVVKMGGEINLEEKVKALYTRNKKITELEINNQQTGKSKRIKADYVFSSMPVRDLILSIKNKIPSDVMEIARGLMYRDFITVGLLLKKLKIKNETNIKTINNIVPDNWIYIQERDVKVGRLQIFNNWSPYMVKDTDNVWIGLEYFCNEGDDLWNMPSKRMLEFAIDELVKIDIIRRSDVLDGTVIHVPKTYPAYFGTYNKFDIIKEYVNEFENLFLIGRNGMHRYNNMDHSMLSAMTAVDLIIAGDSSKDSLWQVNAEEEYHEEKGK